MRSSAEGSWGFIEETENDWTRWDENEWDSCVEILRTVILFLLLLLLRRRDKPF